MPTGGQFQLFRPESYDRAATHAHIFYEIGDFPIMKKGKQ
jgi:hypothetical protein